MDVKRVLFGQLLVAVGGGLLAMGVTVFMVKLIIELAYFVAGGLALVGLALLIVGMFLRRSPGPPHP